MLTDIKWNNKLCWKLNSYTDLCFLVMQMTYGLWFMFMAQQWQASKIFSLIQVAEGNHNT